MTLPTITLVAKDARSPWHVERNHDGAHSLVACGIRIFDSTRETGLDARAVRHAGRAVCLNCRTQVDVELARQYLDGKLDRQYLDGGASVAVEPTKPATRAERSTMTTTAPRKPSEPLLDPATYPTTDVERLKAERLTVSNRISGLTTQVKRSEADKRPALEARLEEMRSRRQMIGDQIKARSTDLVDATQAGASSAANAELAAATKTADKELKTKRPGGKGGTRSRAKK